MQRKLRGSVFVFSPCKMWHSRLKIWEWNRKITLFWRCHRSISWRWGVTSYILCLQLRYHLNIQWSTGADVMLPWPFVAATCRILWPCRGSWSREIWWLAPRFHVNPLDAQRHSCHTLSMENSSIHDSWRECPHTCILYACILTCILSHIRMYTHASGWGLHPCGSLGDYAIQAV